MQDRNDTGMPSLPGWRFDHKVASTDFSDIWLAEDTALQRAVAFKIFAPKADADGIIPPFHVNEWRRRFFLEARLMAGFDHPNIVPVVMMARLADGRPAVALQYMSGSLLDEIGGDIFDPQRLASLGPGAAPRAVTPKRARHILIETLAALAAVHARGLVHRDVKPRNLLLCNGPGSRLKLTDFGMAKVPDEKPSPRPVWIGTRDYISPEQYADAGQVSDRADIHSVGVVGHRLLTGRLPDVDRLDAVEGIPAAFTDLLRRAMAPEPRRRPSAAEMIAALAAIAL